MARDASGTYTRISNSFTQPVTGTAISPTDADAFWDELETEMTDSLSRTGKGGMSADLDMNNNDINEIKTAVFQGSTSGNTTVIATAIAGTTTLTLPAATDTLVGKATTDNLTNKTYNKVTITAPATSATLTLIDGTTLTGPAASGTAMTLGNAETVTGAKTFGAAGDVGKLKIAGTTSGTITVDATAVAGTNTVTLPAATDTLVGKATTDTFTNKTYDTAGTGNSFSINGVAVTANTGTGAVARASSPTFVTPTLGAASATSISFSSTSGIIGTTTNDSAAAGSVGEILSSTVASGSAVALTTATPANVTSISLTAGDWDVSAMVGFTGNTTTTVTSQIASLSTTSATLDTTDGRIYAAGYSGFAIYNIVNTRAALGPARFSVSGATTVYLVAQSSFAVSTSGAFGILRARRVR